MHQVALFVEDDRLSRHEPVNHREILALRIPLPGVHGALLVKANNQGVTFDVHEKQRWRAITANKNFHIDTLQRKMRRKNTREKRSPRRGLFSFLTQYATKTRPFFIPDTICDKNEVQEVALFCYWPVVGLFIHVHTGQKENVSPCKCTQLSLHVQKYTKFVGKSVEVELGKKRRQFLYRYCSTWTQLGLPSSHSAPPTPWPGPQSWATWRGARSPASRGTDWTRWRGRAWTRERWKFPQSCRPLAYRPVRL